jgi:hypothetical protein
MPSQSSRLQEFIQTKAHAYVASPFHCPCDPPMHFCAMAPCVAVWRRSSGEWGECHFGTPPPGAIAGPGRNKAPFDHPSGNLGDGIGAPAAAHRAIANLRARLGFAAPRKGPER